MAEFHRVFFFCFHLVLQTYPSFLCQAYFQAVAPKVSLVAQRGDDRKDKCLTEESPPHSCRGFSPSLTEHNNRSSSNRLLLNKKTTTLDWA